MKHITVIGGGTMGNGIAHVFAQSGYQVNLVEVNERILQKALATITTNMDRQIAKGVMTNSKKTTALNQLKLYTKLEDAIKDADLVIEAASESLAVKLSIFKQLDEICPPKTILASNTSSISITQIAAATQRADKVIGMHFMNPVPVMKLVEIIRGYSTSQEVCQQVMDVSKKLGKVAVEVNDYPGFVANKILMSMINEAIITLYEGIAGVEEIDTIMKLGMSHPMGPLQLADFIGLDVCLNIMRVLQDGFGNTKYAPCPLLINMVTAGHLGIKSGQGFYDYSEGKKNLILANRFKTAPKNSFA